MKPTTEPALAATNAHEALTGFELARLAVLLDPAGARSENAETRARAARRAFDLWETAQEVLKFNGLTADQHENQEVWRRAVAADAEHDAQKDATDFPDRLITFTDTQLWAAVADGPKNGHESPSDVANRLFKRAQSRAKQDGVSFDFTQRGGAPFGLLLKLLLGERKRGPKSSGKNSKKAEKDLRK